MLLLQPPDEGPESKQLSPPKSWSRCRREMAFQAERNNIPKNDEKKMVFEPGTINL